MAIMVNYMGKSSGGATLASGAMAGFMPVSYTHLRAHETVLDLVCRLLLEKKKTPLHKGIHVVC